MRPVVISMRLNRHRQPTTVPRDRGSEKGRPEPVEPRKKESAERERMYPDHGGEPGDDVSMASCPSERGSPAKQCDHLRNRYASITGDENMDPEPFAGGPPQASAPDQNGQPDHDSCRPDCGQDRSGDSRRSPFGPGHTEESLVIEGQSHSPAQFGIVEGRSCRVRRASCAARYPCWSRQIACGACFWRSLSVGIVTLNGTMSNRPAKKARLRGPASRIMVYSSPSR